MTSWRDDGGPRDLAVVTAEEARPIKKSQLYHIHKINRFQGFKVYTTVMVKLTTNDGSRQKVSAGQRRARRDDGIKGLQLLVFDLDLVRGDAVLVFAARSLGKFDRVQNGRIFERLGEHVLEDVRGGSVSIHRVGGAVSSGAGGEWRWRNGLGRGGGDQGQKQRTGGAFHAG